MSDLLATLLGFGFTLLVCLLALHALLSPLLRRRRQRSSGNAASPSGATSEPETTPVHS
jgi:hypothetical protein